MCYLIDLSISALEAYKNHHLEEGCEFIEKMQNSLENMEWEDVWKNKLMCKCILFGLEIIEQEGFKGLSISRIGDCRSMMGELKLWLY